MYLTESYRQRTWSQSLGFVVWLGQSIPVTSGVVSSTRRNRLQEHEGGVPHEAASITLPSSSSSHTRIDILFVFDSSRHFFRYSNDSLSAATDDSTKGLRASSPHNLVKASSGSVSRRGLVESVNETAVRN